MHNLPGSAGATRAPQDADLTSVRLSVLLALMKALHSMERPTWLALQARGEPILYVRVALGDRKMAVLAVQERAGWAYCWDGDRKAAADGTTRAALHIAAVTR